MSEKPFQRILTISDEKNKATINDNGFSGIANVMGVIDSYRSVFYPGSFTKKCLDTFSKKGFITYSHNTYSAFPIAMPTKIRTEGYALLLDATFHSDDNSQALRKICLERADNNLDIGLSVGGSSVEEIYFKCGKDLLAHAKGKGCDMSLFDTANIEKVDNGIWGIPEVGTLREVAITFQPAVPGCDVSMVKSEFMLNRTSVLDFIKENPDLREAIEDLWREIPIEEEKVVDEHTIRDLENRFRMLRLKAG